MKGIPPHPTPVLPGNHSIGPAGKAWATRPSIAARAEPPWPSVRLTGGGWRMWTKGPACGHSLMRLVELGAMKKSGRYSHLMSTEFMGMAWLQRQG